MFSGGCSVSVRLLAVLCFLRVFRVDLRHYFFGHRNPVRNCRFDARTWLIKLREFASGQDRRSDKKYTFAAFVHTGSIAHNVRFVFASIGLMNTVCQGTHKNNILLAYNLATLFAKRGSPADEFHGYSNRIRRPRRAGRDN
jgi:hypothetical protein